MSAALKGRGGSPRRRTAARGEPLLARCALQSSKGFIVASGLVVLLGLGGLATGVYLAGAGPRAFDHWLLVAL